MSGFDVRSDEYEKKRKTTKDEKRFSRAETRERLADPKPRKP